MPTVSLHVVSVCHVQAYELRIEFNDGSVKTVDLANELHGEVFLPLKDISYFKKVAVNPETNTIEWPNGADFAPEFLHEVGQPARLGAAALVK